MAVGKKQHKGAYTLGYHNKPQTQHSFPVGTNVYNVKTGLEGVIVDKKRFKSNRSVVLFKTKDKCFYIRRELLRTIDNHKNIVDKQLEKTRITKNNSSRRKQDYNKKIDDFNLIKSEFKQKKKKINELLENLNPNKELFSSCGNYLNRCPWLARVSTKHDFYKFVLENDNKSIEDLFNKEKVLKIYLIDIITKEFIKKSKEKYQGDKTTEVFEKLMNEKDTSQRKFYYKYNLHELNKMCDYKIDDFNEYLIKNDKSVGSDFEIVE